MEEKLLEYLEAILSHYQIVKNEKDINFLDNPTPANLKRLCLEILERDFLPKDREIFNNFFEPEPKTLHGFIKSMNADSILKTPSNFLRKGKTITKIEHADILAILLNFEPRPYYKFKKTDHWNKNPEDKEETAPIATEIIEGAKIEESNSFIQTQITPITRSEDTSVKINWKKKIVTSLAVVFFISLTGFLVHKSTEPKCMIWKEDHYERIDCEQSSNLGLLKFAQVFPYDEILFDNFKKLTITDTTSFFNKNGDPIVWYSKQNNDCEYFTWEGIHPISRKKLKPISRTIINNYILKWNEKQSN